MSEKKVPKKRGRKPKKTINKEIDEKSENVKVNNTLIIKLNHIDNNDDIIEPYSMDKEQYSLSENNYPSEVCWNCCHKFNEIIYGIPLKYVHNIFYTYGDFCSLECCSRYSLDNFENHYEINSLINLYNNIVNDTKGDTINTAPNRLLLNMFGGPLTIEEYRKNSLNKNIFDLKIPPILPIKYRIDTYEINNNQNTKSNLKLYRKKPLKSEEKSITNAMKLNIK
tara:strand:+ start:790 stop:1461 length:672 start_codon:yes stop_codon:yes gene_type:complete